MTAKLNSDLYCRQLDRLKNTVDHKHTAFANRRGPHISDSPETPRAWLGYSYTPSLQSRPSTKELPFVYGK